MSIDTKFLSNIASLTIEDKEIQFECIKKFIEIVRTATVSSTNKQNNLKININEMRNDQTASILEDKVRDAVVLTENNFIVTPKVIND